jgi:hypothetical protein
MPVKPREFLNVAGILTEHSHRPHHPAWVSSNPSNYTA